MHKYLYRDKVFYILPCTYEDIPHHFSEVSSYYREDEIVEQGRRMYNAVKADTAYKLVDEDDKVYTFAYWERVDKHNVMGIALWWITVNYFIIALEWMRCYGKCRYIHIRPHKEGSLPFLMLLSDGSIRSHHQLKTPLTIDIHSAKTKRMYDLFRKMKVQEVKSNG